MVIPLQVKVSVNTDHISFKSINQFCKLYNGFYLPWTDSDRISVTILEPVILRFMPFFLPSERYVVVRNFFIFLCFQFI